MKRVELKRIGFIARISDGLTFKLNHLGLNTPCLWREIRSKLYTPTHGGVVDSVNFVLKEERAENIVERATMKKRRPARRTGLQNTEQPHAHL